MKTYMPLNGLRWSRNSGSANCDMPQSAVFGQPGGGRSPLPPYVYPQNFSYYFATDGSFSMSHSAICTALRAAPFLI